MVKPPDVTYEVLACVSEEPPVTLALPHQPSPRHPQQGQPLLCSLQRQGDGLG